MSDSIILRELQNVISNHALHTTLSGDMLFVFDDLDSRTISFIKHSEETNRIIVTGPAGFIVDEKYCAIDLGDPELFEKCVKHVEYVILLDEIEK